MSDPAKLLLQNQFGEESVNNVLGDLIPLVPDSNIILISGAGAPTNGGSGTGHGEADKGSLYLDTSGPALYQNTGTLSSPTWTIFEAGDASVLATALTGFSSGAGTLSATDSILAGFNKLSGNLQNKTVLANVLTGFTAGAGTIASTDTVLQGFNKLVGNTQNLSVLANVLTGFSSGAGTVSSSDTILQAFDKLVGNTQNLSVISNVLTGFSASAGSVSSADTILGALRKIYGNMTALQTAAETLNAAGAISTTNPETIINNATGGSFTMTLAAPSSQDGQLKIIKLGTATNGATLAMTNIVGPGFCTLSGTTTLTFTSSGDCSLLMAVGSKWQLFGGNAIAS